MLEQAPSVSNYLTWVVATLFFWVWCCSPTTLLKPVLRGWTDPFQMFFPFQVVFTCCFTAKIDKDHWPQPIILLRTAPKIIPESLRALSKLLLDSVRLVLWPLFWGASSNAQPHSGGGTLSCSYLLPLAQLHATSSGHVTCHRRDQCLLLCFPLWGGWRLQWGLPSDSFRLTSVTSHKASPQDHLSSPFLCLGHFLVV